MREIMFWIDSASMLMIEKAIMIQVALMVSALKASLAFIIITLF